MIQEKFYESAEAQEQSNQRVLNLLQFMKANTKSGVSLHEAANQLQQHPSETQSLLNALEKNEYVTCEAVHGDPLVEKNYMILRKGERQLEMGLGLDPDEEERMLVALLVAKVASERKMIEPELKGVSSNRMAHIVNMAQEEGLLQVHSAQRDFFSTQHVAITQKGKDMLAAVDESVEVERDRNLTVSDQEPVAA